MGYSGTVQVSTTPALEGWEILDYVKVVTAHVGQGTGFIGSFFDSFSDAYTGRNEAYQQRLASIDEAVVEQVKEEAAACGANWVVGLRIDREDKAFMALMETLDGHPLAMRALLLRLQEHSARALLAELKTQFEGAEGDDRHHRRFI